MFHSYYFGQKERDRGGKRSGKVIIVNTDMAKLIDQTQAVSLREKKKCYKIALMKYFFLIIANKY